MAKPKLNKLTKDWVDEEKNNKSGPGRPKSSKIKVKKTICITKQAEKLIWMNKAENGENMSEAIDRLILNNLGKKT